MEVGLRDPVWAQRIRLFIRAWSDDVVATPDYTQNPQELILFVLCPTPVVSRFLGGCSASQNGHAKAIPPVFTFRRSFSGTLCLGHFSSAMLIGYTLSKSLQILWVEDRCPKGNS
jgi:hypothetical protein